MDIKAVGCQRFESENGKIKVFVENDVTFMELHNFYMDHKGFCVTKIVETHQKDVENMKQWQKANGMETDEFIPNPPKAESIPTEDKKEEVKVEA